MSDENIHIDGGTTVVQGPYDNSKVAVSTLGELKITNGMLVASGPNAGSLIKSPDNTSTQNSPENIRNKDNLINIQDAGGNSLVTFKPIKKRLLPAVFIAGIENRNYLFGFYRRQLFGWNYY